CRPAQTAAACSLPALVPATGLDRTRQRRQETVVSNRLAVLLPELVTTLPAMWASLPMAAAHLPFGFADQRPRPEWQSFRRILDQRSPRESDRDHCVRQDTVAPSGRRVPTW